MPTNHISGHFHGACANPARHFSEAQTMFRNFSRSENTRLLEFDVEPAMSSVVSALRRCILADVKTVAFAFDSIDPAEQDVTFVKNTAPLHNEYIGERIGLVPLHLSREEIDKFDPESWRFELSAKSLQGDFLDVTTKDISIVNTGPTEIALVAKEVFPPDPVTGDHIILARLRPERRGVKEELVLEAKASHGCGADHARWCPACHCVSMPLPDDDRIAKAREAAEDKHRFDAIERKMIYKKDGFRFKIESACGMTPEEIFASGMETLQRMFRDLGEALTRRDAESVRVVRDEGRSATLKLLGQSDTVGAVLQQWVFDKVDFVGYNTPHPTEKSIAITVSSDRDVHDVLHDACVEISRHLDSMIAEWGKVVKPQPR